VSGSPDLLYEEVSFIAYHFHWSLDSILDLEHRVRRRFIHQISEINHRINGD
jgi:hypothetical protein